MPCNIINGVGNWSSKANFLLATREARKIGVATKRMTNHRDAHTTSQDHRLSRVNSEKVEGGRRLLALMMVSDVKMREEREWHTSTSWKARFCTNLKVFERFLQTLTRRREESRSAGRRTSSPKHWNGKVWKKTRQVKTRLLLPFPNCLLKTWEVWSFTCRI